MYVGMSEPLHNIVVLGGGTAGWLSAYMLQDFCRQHGISAKLTVVDSSKIPTIGVGEGTTAIFKTFMESFGLEEQEFLRETHGTIKYGIRHRDWKRLGHQYDGPIDDPHFLIPKEEPDDFEFINAYCIASGRCVSEAHLFQKLLSEGLAPVRKIPDGSLEPNHPFLHAFHIDNIAVGRYLRKKAKGIEIIDGVFEEVQRDPQSGNINALKLDGQRKIEGDFFIDCSGFSRLLVEQVFQSDWISYKDELPVNRAMPFFLDHDPAREIPPYTLAWAQGSGWMWQIPTQDRMGCGYVYSDEFLSPDEAHSEIESVLGESVEPRQDLRFEVGRVQDSWKGNCLAIGLSAGFLEPLEATSIHSTLVQLILFSKEYLEDVLHGNDRGRERFNQRIGRQFDDFKTFLNIHYRGERDDTPFWQHVHDHCLGEESARRLEMWKRELPMISHFQHYLSGLPHVETQLYYPVLDGMGLLNQQKAREEMARRKLKRKAQQQFQQLKDEYKQMTTGSLGHREYLLKLTH